MSGVPERSIYLIKHAEPLVRPDVPAEQWELSPRGIDQARMLGLTAASWKVRAVYASTEPKATATALIIAEPLGLQAHVIDGVEELRIGGWIGNADEFNDRVREILEHPQRQLPGAETAAAAAARFDRATDTIAAGELPAAVVSHGRILAAYVSQILGEPDPFAVWRSIPFGGVGRVDLDPQSRLGEAFSSVGPER